jgi:hypothetical protein
MSPIYLGLCIFAGKFVSGLVSVAELAPGTFPDFNPRVIYISLVDSTDSRLRCTVLLCGSTLVV